MTLKKLLRSYSTVHFWWDGFYGSVWRQFEIISNSQADHDTKLAIDRKLYEIKEMIEGAYRGKIGDQTMLEIRTKNE